MIAFDIATACRQAIVSGPGAARLVELAERREGYVNSDIMVGLLYPDDVDAQMRDIEDTHIPDGSVLVFWPGAEWGGASEELLVPEPAYLAALAEFLAERGHKEAAARLDTWLSRGPASRD